MGEIDVLLDLYGVIDRAVVDDDDLALRLAPILGPYRGGQAIGWYDRGYLPWREDVRQRALARDSTLELGRERSASKKGDRPRSDPPAANAPPPPEPAAEADGPPTATADDPPRVLSERALEASAVLDQFGYLDPTSRSSSRRLLALAAAMKVFPEAFAPGALAPMALSRAMAFDPGLSGMSEEAAYHNAVNLQQLFARDFHKLDDWGPVVNRACDLGYAPEEFRLQAAARPCTGHMVMVEDATNPGDPDPCTVIEANFTTSDITFEQALAYLEPENWPDASDLWCVMEKQPQAVATDSWLYNETVSTGCLDSHPLWIVSTTLQFWFSYPDPDRARLEYDLAAPPGDLDDIEVDEGSLEVVRVGNGCRLNTTKRVRFAGSMDGAWLAMWMCATGYGGILEDVVTTAAKNSAKPTSKPFPIKKPKKGVPPVTKAKKSTAAGEAGGEYSNSDETLDDVMDEGVSLAKEFLEDVNEATQAAYAKVATGQYGIEDAWANGIGMWAAYMKGLGKLADLGMRAAKAYAAPSTASGSEEDPT
jgi:hypothetical protein